MAKEIPGFYYDAEKNRYFPCNRGVQGSRPPVPPPQDPKKDVSSTKRLDIRQGLLYARELCGNVILSRRGKVGFETEYQKKRAKKPVIVKCKKTKKIGNIALEHVVADVSTPDGPREIDALLSAGVNGLLCLHQVGKPQKERISDHLRFLNPLFPAQSGLTQSFEFDELYGSVIRYRSEISSVKVWKKGSSAMPKKFVITTMGSDKELGAVWVLDLTEPLQSDGIAPIAWSGLSSIARYKQTLWTADSDCEGRNISIGTNRGVMVIDMETGVQSWLFKGKSDALSLQYDLSGRNIVLSGLRNGAILNLDPRRKQIGGKACSIATMPSSVCCLTSLELWDQYFLASSMDGSMRLYDHRLVKRGPVQSYDGHVNSHTRINFAVDPSEKFILSGGEDCYIRLWDIKSGELILSRLVDSVASAVCWPKMGGKWGPSKVGEEYGCYWETHSWGAWLGSYERILYMDWHTE